MPQGKFSCGSSSSSDVCFASISGVMLMQCFVKSKTVFKEEVPV